MPAKSPLLPSQGHTGCLVSFQLVNHLPPTLFPALGAARGHPQLCSGQRMGTHMSPYLARSSDTLFLRDARGLGLPHSWVQTQLRENTREGSLWVAHSQEQGAPPQRSRSGTSAALGWVLGARRFSGFTARLRHPRPESGSSAVTVPRGGLTCCPCGRPSTAGWRPACPRARSRRLGIPLASAARLEPLREWAAATACLLVGRTPAPRPPCTRPARPGEKALIGKIAQERGRGAGGRGRAVSSGTQAAWRRAPPSMSSPPFEDRWGDGGGARFF